MRKKVKVKRTKRGNAAVRFGGKLSGSPTAVSMVGYSPKQSRMKRKVLVTVKMKMSPQKAAGFKSSMQRSLH